MERIASVVVDLALDREFDYLIPDSLASQVDIGTQVEVPFGRTRKRGFVIGLKDKSEWPNLKPLGKVVGDKPLIQKEILKLAQWMADYYAAPIEQVVKTVLPSAVRKKDAKFKEVLFVIPTELASDEEAAAPLRKKAPKQAAALDVLIASGTLPLAEVAKAAGAPASAIRALEDKGFVRITKEPMARDPLAGQNFLRTKNLTLTPEQSVALARTVEAIDTGKPPVILLFGVTGSGETEVYLQSIEYALKQGKGAIVLVPEIALTPQTVERFHSRFGNEIGVLHSHLSDGERHDEWHKIRDGKVKVVVGARSALFAPVENLGLIVVDEEHEQSYKQEETPRYNARDIAVMRGHLQGCAVMLGSATPSVESFYNAHQGKYACVNLSGRVDDRKMPVIRVVDMRAEHELTGEFSVLSRDLTAGIHERIARGEQVMIFLNRRGYATSMICTKCGYVEECNNCSVSMTYHRKADELACHLCGDMRQVPKRCPAPGCGDPDFKQKGLGTEKIESILMGMFKKAVVRRMDSDTMTRKDSYQQILGQFRTGKIDILVGTQMIAKGLHFPNVTLVGVINADTTLHMPDFRAGERTFQLITQVSGRAGRGEVSGEVFVQTYTPTHPAIQASRTLDYDNFIDQELEFRKMLKYPPFSHMVCVTIRSPDEALVQLTATEFYKMLEPMLEDEHVIVASPTPAPIAKMKGSYRFQIIMRAEFTRRMTIPLRHALKHFKWPSKVQVAVDVDALSLV